MTFFIIGLVVFGAAFLIPALALVENPSHLGSKKLRAVWIIALITGPSLVLVGGCWTIAGLLIVGLQMGFLSRVIGLLALERKH